MADSECDDTDDGGLFQKLPDELVLAVLRATRDLCLVVRFGETCRRLHALAADDGLWKDMCAQSAHGLPPHVHFAAFGKNWQWLYRARLPLSVAKRKQRRSSVGAANRDDGYTYQGDFRRKCRHGYGRAVINTAHGAYVYEGQWARNKENGRGIAAWPGGACYRGGWANGKRRGRGIVTYGDGHAYDAEWVKNKVVGPGVHILPDGERRPCARIDGEWRDMVQAIDEKYQPRASMGATPPQQHATAVAALFEPGRYTLCRDEEEYGMCVEHWENQRRTRGFDDTETWSLDSVLARFAIDLVDALAADKRPPPQPDLVDRARAMQKALAEPVTDRWDLYRDREITTARVDGLCALIAQWPAFGEAFARFAVPRIEAFRRYDGNDCPEWGCCLQTIAESIQWSATHGEPPPCGFALLRNHFFSLWWHP
ncbi:F-box domain containing protein [Pandoravirus quercus]|uniref:F-box domain containing protein n=2 Tax=Pandoravirus TaxID=2060084 RepID=A0A2U7U9W0_9VIRU|nr:F-box domain containing protein [Pandoravirus quercus]AVK75224.1 F-box domain containing protein [Pandoravirus quercus]QBZ81395.1 morn repeat incomplete domain containing protein [Pandoravirus celtis]